MEHYKAERNEEFYNIARNNYKETIDKLLDAKAALAGRK